MATKFFNIIKTLNQKDVLNFLICIMLSYVIAESIYTYMFKETIQGWLYLLILGIPVAIIPCGIIYFTYLLLVNSITTMKYVTLRYFLIVILGILFLSLVVWREGLYNKDYIIQHPNYYLIFTIISIIQIDIYRILKPVNRQDNADNTSN
jgi:hypothetical protein